MSHKITGLVSKGQAADVIYFDFSRWNYFRWIENCWKSYNRGVLLIFHCQKEACVKNVLIKSVDDTNLSSTVSKYLENCEAEDQKKKL